MVRSGDLAEPLGGSSLRIYREQKLYIQTDGYTEVLIAVEDGEFVYLSVPPIGSLIEYQSPKKCGSKLGTDDSL